MYDYKILIIKEKFKQQKKGGEMLEKLDGDDRERVRCMLLRIDGLLATTNLIRKKLIKITEGGVSKENQLMVLTTCRDILI